MKKSTIKEMFAIALFILIFSGVELKAETVINFGMFSKHFNKDASKKYNESHDLIGVQHNGYVLSTFVNSYSQRTWYAGKVKTLAENSGFKCRIQTRRAWVKFAWHFCTLSA